MCVEVAVGIAADSLALLSDAAHMLTDAGALALSLVAIRLARRPAAGAMTYGLKRTEILAAAINGSTLLVLGLLIVYEGVRRLIDPPEVAGRAGADRRRARHRREPRRHARARAREPPVAERRGRVPAHPHRPRRVRGDGDRRRRDPAHRVRARGRDRRAVRRRVDAARRPDAAAGVRPRVPGGRAARARPAGDRPPDGRATPASPRSTTCTSGRSRPASRRSPPMSWSGATPIATTSGVRSRRCCTPSSRSSTPPCRSSTRAASSSRSRSGRGNHPAGHRHEVRDGGRDHQRVEDLVEAERVRPRVRVAMA